MLISGNDAFAAQPALQVLARKSVKLSAAVKIAKILNELAILMEQLESQRMTLIRQYAVVGEDGNPQLEAGGLVVFADGQRNAFVRDWAEKLKEQVDLEIAPVELSALGEIEIEADVVAVALRLGLVVEIAGSR